LDHVLVIPFVEMLAHDIGLTIEAIVGFVSDVMNEAGMAGVDKSLFWAWEEQRWRHRRGLRNGTEAVSKL
jgi:hypothetical protein